MRFSSKRLTLSLLIPLFLLAGCGSNETEKFTSDIYLGNSLITKDGTQGYIGFDNITYENSTNTLTILTTAFRYSYCNATTYEDIFLGGAKGNIGDVGFLFSYTGTKKLNINIKGDIEFINDSTEENAYYGGFYFDKNPIVNIYGPGKIKTTKLNHSLIYGQSANISFDNVIVDSANESCSFGIACDQASFIDSHINVSVAEGGYSGLYIPNGTYNMRSTFNASGYSYGYYCGTSFYYDNCYLNSSNTEMMSANFYALYMNDSYINVISNGSGIACFDGGTFTNCKGYVYSAIYYCFQSIESTLDFINCEFDALVDNGIGIQAWNVYLVNSSINVTSLNGFAITSEFNAHVPEENKCGIHILGSNIEAKGSICAIYSTDELEISNTELLNNQKLLSKHCDKYNTEMTAICEEGETELVLSDEEEEGRICPTNGAKSVSIDNGIKASDRLYYLELFYKLSEKTSDVEFRPWGFIDSVDQYKEEDKKAQQFCIDHNLIYVYLSMQRIED